jgi:hydroxyethylthiazole kinase-like uncharacterized protein yjeF
MRIVNNTEMQNIESKTFEDFGFSEQLVVENVGIRTADFIDSEVLVGDDFGELVAVIGKGNNGADALAAARHLVNYGYTVRAFMLFTPEELSEEAKNQAMLAEKYGVRLTKLSRVEELESYFSQTQDRFFILDGILGSGFKGPLSNYLFDIVSCINQWSDMTVSIDIPSGIETNSGKAFPEAIKADYTMAVGLPKVGFYIGNGPQHVGEICTVNAGFPQMTLEGGDKFLLTQEVIQNFIPRRDKFAHKNTYGHTLVIAGSPGLSGAASLAAQAALRVGSGLVTAVTWKDSYYELVARMPAEIMCGLIPSDEQGILEEIRSFDDYRTIIIGPGLGISERSRDVVLKVLNHFSGAVVVDADAIKLLDLSKDLELLSHRKGPTILTPHIGEFAQLIGVDKNIIVEEPITHLRKTIDKTNAAIVLKSSSTFLGFPNNEIFINHLPNDGMATGGTGDVLAGILGGLLSQMNETPKSSGIFENKTALFHTLCLGVSLHSIAGQWAAKEQGVRSMTAGSIIEFLNQAIKQLELDID